MAKNDKGSKGASSKQVKETSKKKRRVGVHALVVTLIVVLCVLGCAAVALAIDDGHRTQTVPTRTILDNSIDISGMTAEQLEQTVNARVENGISNKVTVKLDGKTYELDMDKIGKADTDATIEAAFAPYSKSVLWRYADRIVSLVSGDVATYRISTALTPSTKKLESEIEKIAKKIDVEAASAGYAYSGGKLVTTSAKTGKKVDVSATAKKVKKALSSNTDATDSTISVKGVVKTTKPSQTEPGQAIFVDTSACELYFYEDGKVKASYPCTPGKAGYETPTGDWTLEYKDPAPRWENPHSDWSAGMPETIEPGASNPLGLRALAVSCGGGIYIHGTTNTGQLGSPGSHGCVRLANANIVELYDMVETGIPIIIR
ncbi:MAG: L,D-transpeptidase family protein [Coriobacteriales bacterium]|jgi:lipoprotein-anchoring transpeptidase ErfK/SrfK